MAVTTGTAVLLLLGAALAAMAVAADAAGECAPGVRLPQCATCIPLTADELAARKAAVVAKKAAWEAKKAAKQPGTTPRRLLGEGHRGNHTGWNHTGWNYKCTACLTGPGYAPLSAEGFCACKPGYGFVLPTDGSRPKATCDACPASYASGPDAPKPPKPDWSKFKGKKGGPGSDSGGGRRLLGFGHGKHGSICVKCPGDASDDRTKCL